MDEEDLATDRLLVTLYAAVGTVLEAHLIEKQERANTMGFTYDLPQSALDKLRLLRRFIERIEPMYESVLLELEREAMRD